RARWAYGLGLVRPIPRPRLCLAAASRTAMKELLRMGFFEVFSSGASRTAAPKTGSRSVIRVCAIALSLTLTVELMACQTPMAPPPPPPQPPRMVFAPPPPPPPPQPPPPPGRMEQPNYYRLRNTQRDIVPARV